MSKAPAVDYALEIIEFFSKNNNEIGIADISNALNINKNAVSSAPEPTRQLTNFANSGMTVFLLQS